MNANQELIEADEKTEPQVTENIAVLQVIERAASNASVDVEKMERLLQMQTDILDRGAKQLFNEAMNAVQTEIRPIAADASNPQTKSKYASYSALDKVLRPIYSSHGFSLSFGTDDGAPESYVRVVCDVMHTGGHEKRYHADIPADGKGAKGGDVMTKTHAFGSATSYGMRYLVKMIFNIAIGDDDGNAASDTNQLITAEQSAWVNDALDKTESDKAKFCAAFKVNAVPQIRMCDFGRADKMLRSKAKNNGVELD